MSSTRDHGPPVKNANGVATCNTQSLTNHHERTYIHMSKRDGAHDEDYDMLVIGSGLGGRVAALQLTKAIETGILPSVRRGNGAGSR